MAGPEPYGLVKLKGALYGDDNWATVLDEEPPYTNDRGIEMKRYLIVPGEHLIKQYPELQKPGALTYKGIALWVEYPTYWISDKNPSRTNAIVRIDCGFDGRETEQTKRHKFYTDEIRRLNEENENLKISNMTQREENKLLLGNTTELIKKIAEITNQLKGEKHGPEDTTEGYPSQV